MQSMVFNIPIENMPKLEKKLASLNKKAKKAGTGELKLTVVSETAEKQDDGYVNVFKQVVVEGEPPKISGWTFLARLDHNVDPTGASNLVYVMPGQTLPQELWDFPADCEHCGWTRKRRDTYFLREDATGKLKQVGRTCIQDFIGIDPEKVLAHAERLSSLYDTARDAESEPLDRTAMNDYRLIDVESFLQYVAMTIRLDGWVSSKQAYDNYGVTSTRDLALGAMFPTAGFGCRRNEIEEVDIKTAESARLWVMTLDASKNEFTHNMATIVKTGYVDWKAAGTAAYIVQGYLKEQEKQTTQRDLSSSVHFAQKGDKIRGDVEIISKKVVPMKDWDQFQKTLVRMLSKDGNLLVTFSTGEFGNAANVGDKITIRGTVTKNDEFNNVKQTIINRVRIV